MKPDIGGMFAAKNGKPFFDQSFTDDAGVVHVVCHHFPYLLLPLRGIDCFGSTLHNVGGAVELGGLPSVP